MRSSGGGDTRKTGDEMTMVDRTGECVCGAIRFKITAPLMASTSATF
jgi:hypothetical protein